MLIQYSSLCQFSEEVLVCHDSSHFMHYTSQYSDVLPLLPQCGMLKKQCVCKAWDGISRSWVVVVCVLQRS